MSTKAFNLDLLNSRRATSVASPMTLLHPVTKKALTVTDDDGVAHPVRIFLYGTDSDVSENHAREVQRTRLAEPAAARKDTTPEEIEDRTLDLLVALTSDWEYVGLGSEDSLPCTPENIRKVYKSIPWIQRQVDGYVVNLANYLGN